MSPTKTIVIITMLVLQGTDALRMGRLKVPPYRLRGENALLVCEYDMEDDAVYSVKWYKDDEEFYRYVPKSSPPKSSYLVPGVKVDHALSDDKTVTLRSVNLQSSGMYRCEVSAEAPSFASAQREARMEVVYLPKDGPHITGDKEYQIGDEVNLNCTSGKSYPASVLHWYINNQQVVRPDWLVALPQAELPHGLVSSALGLRFRPAGTNPQRLHVRCVASVAPGLQLLDRRQPLLRDALLLVKASSSHRCFPDVVALAVMSLVLLTTA